MSLKNPELRQMYGKIILVVVALIIGAAVVAPFFFSRHETNPYTNEISRLPYTHDLGTHVTIMKQFDDGLRSGVLYPRWLADTNYGYGVATMVYYPPNVFYMCSIIHIFVKDWIDTMFVLAALSVAFSGIALYWYLRLFYGRTASLGAAFVYMLLPYHQIDLYLRGAFPEFMGFVFVPLILRAVFKLGREGHFKQYAVLSLLYGMYVMTHLPVGYIFTYVLAFYVLLWAFIAKDWKILFRVGAGLSLGLGLAAIYWLPAALESKAAYEWVSAVFPYHDSYLNPFATHGDAFSKLMRKIFRYQGAILIVATAVLLFIKRRKNLLAQNVDEGEVLPDQKSVNPLPFNEKSANSAVALQEGLWVVMALLTMVMVTKISYPVSVLIPKIEVAVPPFRWLLIASVFTSFLIAAALQRLLKLENSRAYLLWIFRVAIVATLALNLWLTFQGVIKAATLSPTYHAPAEFEDKGWIPANAAEPKVLPKTERAMIATGGVCEIVSWQPQYRVINVDSPSSAFLRLKTYNFPGWIARVDGQPVEIKSDSFGTQVFPIPAGKHRVEVEFVNTPPRTLGAAVSSVCFLIALGFFALDFMKRRKAISTTPSA